MTATGIIIHFISLQTLTCCLIGYLKLFISIFNILIFVQES